MKKYVASFQFPGLRSVLYSKHHRFIDSIKSVNLWLMYHYANPHGLNNTHKKITQPINKIVSQKSVECASPLTDGVCL
jgi:hypothetical protein